MVAPYGNIDEVEKLLKEHKVAAVILEAVVGNAGFIKPSKKFLQKLRELTTKYGALLVFDEVMTGFRVAYGGAQEHFGVTPDITTLGKIIGGGLPVGAYGGRKDIMSMVAPAGPMYQVILHFIFLFPPPYIHFCNRYSIDSMDIYIYTFFSNFKFSDFLLSMNDIKKFDHQRLVH